MERSRKGKGTGKRSWSLSRSRSLRIEGSRGALGQGKAWGTECHALSHPHSEPWSLGLRSETGADVVVEAITEGRRASRGKRDLSWVSPQNSFPCQVERRDGVPKAKPLDGEETGRPMTELTVPEGPGGKGSWVLKERPQLESSGQVSAASWAALAPTVTWERCSLPSLHAGKRKVRRGPRLWVPSPAGAHARITRWMHQ